MTKQPTARPAKRPAVIAPPALMSARAKLLPLAGQWQVRAHADLLVEMARARRLRLERTD